MRLRRLVFPVPFVVLVAAAWAVSAQREPVVNAEADVVFIGSSSVNGALGRMIEFGMQQAGLRVYREGRPSTGLSRPDFYDWQAQIPRFGNLAQKRGVVVYLGGNDAQAFRLRPTEVPPGTPQHRTWIIFGDEARWSEAYRRRAREFVDALCQAGARKVVLIPPIDGEVSDGHAERIRRVQRLQVEGARASRCGVVANPADVELGPELAGDGVHLNRAGARIVWDSIGPTILGALR